MFVWGGCDSPLTEAEDIEATGLFSCAEDCFSCHADCTNRQCGPDGCGGSCGGCLSTEQCTATGRCGSAGDTCSACLASCRGYTGTDCCTGCGCLCEDECGDCF